APILQAELQDGRDPTTDAGVGEDAVDLSEHLDRPGERREHLLLVADIAPLDVDAPAGLGELLAGGFVLLRVGTPGRDIGAGVSETRRHAEADAAVAPGDEGDMSGEIDHRNRTVAGGRDGAKSAARSPRAWRRLAPDGPDSAPTTAMG